MYRLRLAVSALILIPATANAAPVFQDATNNFNAQGCNGSGCWTNHLRVVDFDGDDDLDIVFPNYAGFFSQGSAQQLVMYENDGSGGMTMVSQAAVGGHTARLRQVAFGDVDGDGDLDMYAPDGGGGADAFFFNNGDGTFTNMAPGVSSRAGFVRFADIDDDGDLDLLLGDGYAQGGGASAILHIYTNDGTGSFTEDAAAVPANWTGIDMDDIDVFDADRDWDLDLLINSHRGKSNLYLNDGSGTFTDATSQLDSMNTQNFHYGPSVCDVDGDGDLDVWIDNVASGYAEQLQINDGSGNFSDETAARVTGNPGADDNGVQCVDFDHDGDFDAAVVSLSNNERILENDGNGNFTTLPDAFPSMGDPSLWLEFGDVSGDDKLDAVTGQGEGNPQTNRLYLGNANAVADTLGPTIIAVDAAPDMIPEGDPAPVIHAAISDGTVTDDGPHLLAKVVKVTGAETADVPMFYMGGDVFRAELPVGAAGEHTYEVCATDWAGNETCDTSRTYTVGGAGGSSGGGTGGSDSATTTDGTASGTGGSASGTSTATATATDSGTTDPSGSGTSSSTSDTDGDGMDSDSKGCNCTATGGAPWGASFLGLFVLGLVRRRR